MKLLEMCLLSGLSINKKSALRYDTTEEMEAALLWVAFKCVYFRNGEYTIPDSDEYQGWYINELSNLAILNRPHYTN